MEQLEIATRIMAAMYTRSNPTPTAAAVSAWNAAGALLAVAETAENEALLAKQAAKQAAKQVQPQRPGNTGQQLTSVVRTPQPVPGTNRPGV